MRRNLAAAARVRPEPRGARSIASLAFVIALAIAFWTGALWLAEFLFRIGSLKL